MPIYIAIDGRVEHNGNRAPTRYPTTFVPESATIAGDMDPIFRFAAADGVEARETLRRVAGNGCSQQPPNMVLDRDGQWKDRSEVVDEPVKPWHYRETPHYVSKAIKALGIAVSDRQFIEMKRHRSLQPMDRHLSELCRIYHSYPKEGAIPRIPPVGRSAIDAQFDMARGVRDMLAILARAADDSYNQARLAFGYAEDHPFLIEKHAEPPAADAEPEQPRRGKHHHHVKP